MLGRDVLAVRKLEEILFAIGDKDVALVIFITNVAGRKPSIIHHCLGRVRVTIITAHDVWSAHEHLAVRSDGNVDSGEWSADRADAIVSRPVGADDASFGHAIALQDVYARTEKRIRKCRREWRAARNEVTQAPAHAFAPFRKHEGVGNGVTGFQ